MDNQWQTHQSTRICYRYDALTRATEIDHVIITGPTLKTKLNNESRYKKCSKVLQDNLMHKIISLFECNMIQTEVML